MHRQGAKRVKAQRVHVCEPRRALWEPEWNIFLLRLICTPPMRQFLWIASRPNVLHRCHACLPSIAFNHSTHAHSPGGNLSGRVPVAVDPPLAPISTSPPPASPSSPSNPSYSTCFSTCSPCSSSSSLLKLTRQTRLLLGALLLMRQRAIIAAF